MSAPARLAFALLACSLFACSKTPPAEHPSSPPPSPSGSAPPSPPASSSGGEDAEAARIEREARIKITTSIGSGLRVGASLWMAAHPGECPSAEDIVNAKLVSSRLTVDDAWGQRFKVICAGEKVVVESPGPDGKPGTADDIAVGR